MAALRPVHILVYGPDMPVHCGAEEPASDDSVRLAPALVRPKIRCVQLALEWCPLGRILQSHQ